MIKRIYCNILIAPLLIVYHRKHYYFIIHVFHFDIIVYMVRFTEKHTFYYLHFVHIRYSIFKTSIHLMQFS